MAKPPILIVIGGPDDDIDKSKQIAHGNEEHEAARTDIAVFVVPGERNNEDKNAKACKYWECNSLSGHLVRHVSVLKIYDC
jgi:hypothetical protein